MPTSINSAQDLHIGVFDTETEMYKDICKKKLSKRPDKLNFFSNFCSTFEPILLPRERFKD